MVQSVQLCQSSVWDSVWIHVCVCVGVDANDFRILRLCRTWKRPSGTAVMQWQDLPRSHGMPVHTWVQFFASTYQAGHPSHGLFSAALTTSVYTKNDCPYPFAAQCESKGLSTCQLQSTVLLQHSAHLGASVCSGLNLNKFVFVVASRMNPSFFVGPQDESLLHSNSQQANEGWQPQTFQIVSVNPTEVSIIIFWCMSSHTTWFNWSYCWAEFVCSVF